VIEIIKSLKSDEKRDLYTDFMKYFRYIKDGEHLWFITLIESIGTKFILDTFGRRHIISRMNSKKNAEDFIDVLNKKYLFPLQVEITANHGFRRTYRFFNDEQRKNTISSVCSLMQKLQEISAYVCLGYGGVLGAVRNGKLIDHDDDLDIHVGFLPEIADTREKAQEILVGFLERSYNRPVSVYGGTHVKLWSKEGGHDVFIGMISDGVFHSDGFKNGVPMEAMFPPVMNDLEGIACPMPADSEKYLELRYGKNWKIPDENFMV